ncbi:MAG: site-specific DNA-methyltransferase [Anaerolineales bacterium]|nr:site-specific DNA-methyltransferase [Anaerolineales bacterium]
MPKKDYSQWDKKELIAHIQKLEKRKKYGLVWDEERTREQFELEALNALPVLTEVPEYEIIDRQTDRQTHILIEGDNYHALSVLSYTHEKKIDVIYIDPPYNRGLRDSNDFRYNDKYVDREDSFRHSKWLSFMAKRLSLARNLLKESGVIFISIDDNELAQLKLLMDEIFGEENYKNTIIIRRGAKNVQAQFDTIDKLSSGYEYVLFYARSKSQRFPKMVKELEQSKQGGWNNHWRGTDRPTMRYELLGIKPKTGQWRWGEERSLIAIENYKQMLKDVGKKELTQEKIDNWFIAKLNETGEEMDMLRLSKNGKPEHYIPPADTTLLNDVWFDFSPNSTSVLKSVFGKKVFDNPKPLELIKRACNFANKDAVIVDFFAGSGTTAHAVFEMNNEDGGTRQVISATNNENNICTEVCYPRLKKVIKGYASKSKKKFKGLGGNLKYYRTSFVPAESSDENKEILTRKSVEMLCLRENTFEFVTETDTWKIYKNQNQYTAILFDQLSIPDLKEELAKFDKPISVYIFSLEDDNFINEFVDMRGKVKVCSIPEAILRVYRRIYK